MKIFKKRQNELQMKSMLRYYIPDCDKFNFYLHEAGFELLNMAEQQGIVSEVYRPDRHYVSYWIRKQADNDFYPIEVVLKLVANKKKRLREQPKQGTLLPIHRVTLYSPDYRQCTNYFTLDSTWLEENENALYQAYNVIENKNYVPSEIDGKYATSYKKIF